MRKAGYWWLAFGQHKQHLDENFTADALIVAHGYKTGLHDCDICERSIEYHKYKSWAEFSS